MDLVDVNEKNMIHLVADDPVFWTLLLRAGSMISFILSPLSLLRINSAISEFFKLSGLLLLFEVNSVRPSLLSTRGLLKLLLMANSALSSLLLKLRRQQFFLGAGFGLTSVQPFCGDPS